MRMEGHRRKIAVVPINTGDMELFKNKNVFRLIPFDSVLEWIKFPHCFPRCFPKHFNY